MRQRYIPSIIMLLAGAIISIINMINQVDMVVGLKRLLFTIIIFYFFGLITKAIIQVALRNTPKTAEVEENQEEEVKPPEENTK